MAKSKAKLSDFRTQERNLNKHRPRGMGMLDNVIAKDGWQGAITTAANGETFAGSARLEVAQERFGDESEPIVFDIDGTRPVILRRVDIPTADDPRAIRLGIADNRISELNYDPDIELLSAIADEVDISDMYFDDELAKLAEQKQEIIDHQEPDFLKFSDNDSFDKKGDHNSKSTDEDNEDSGYDEDQVAAPDMYFPSNNDWDIPLLDINMQAKYLDLPLHGWGTISRKTRNASQTIHFYVDDYRFNAIWKDPDKLVQCNPINVIEPNYTTSHGMGRAMILWLTFKKRWIARYWQTQGIRIFVDAFAPDFEDINFMGVPKEWAAFATRYLGTNPSGEIGGWEQVEEIYDKCREYSTAENLVFVVVGGGKDIESKCAERGWFHVLEFMQKLKKED
jgi:hypothetical protein